MDINRARHCWESMQKALREQLGEAKYYWFKNLTVYSAEKNLLIFTHPDQFTAQHVQKIYGQTLLLSATAYFGMEFDDVAVVTPAEAEILIAKVKENSLNPHYTFENFIVGASNRLAYAAALAVSENPGKEYNPLFIYGGAGLGKTHLITAIANSIRNNQPDLVIEFSNSEKFTNEVVDAIREKRTGEFKARMRRVDVLFVDDVQFLANRVATQVEFFNTFNELYLAEKQIVITSDRPPDEISALEERMRSRFKSGVVADISRPDFETRLAILSLKCQNANIPCEMEALNLIAERVDSNIRELEGALSNCQLLAGHKGLRPRAHRRAHLRPEDNRRSGGVLRGQELGHTLRQALPRGHRTPADGDILEPRDLLPVHHPPGRGVRARPHHGHALAQKGGRDDKGQPGLQPGGRRAEAEIKINRIIA